MKEGRSDRKAALAAALETTEPFRFDGLRGRVIVAAARERLAQLPEKCGTCGGTGIAPDNDTAELGSGVFSYRHCPTCHGSGKVYPPDSPDGLLADVVQKATPYGTQDGDFVASYLLPTGLIHRAIKYLTEHGIPTAALDSQSSGERL